ncbi:phosphorylase family protein [Ascodesmis nigricans]|uniref:S-methyl-5'-thioadenosine phosphorylase n=1 Tax=Ascodesmis nigricans TaxID=341454 RepID=A0A4S2MM74_9PEZI|nr:phosphorylase family protein [Ascodesmis nigricans]
MEGLPNTYSEPIPIAVIGGTGISSLTHLSFTPVAVLNPQTPWGTPSSPITVLESPHSHTPIAFLSRHGLHHELSPSEVPNTANIAALRSLGVRTIVAFSAVGSLDEDIAPEHFVVPDQIIDRTKGIRESTFFSGGCVSHVGFADPFDDLLRRVIIDAAAGLKDVTIHSKGTVICMEGPAFSTRAESKMYQSWGGSVINMSVLPEAKLAREAEMAYAMVCMSTDYDCWKEDEKPVDVSIVMARMRKNGENAKLLVGEILKALADKDGEEIIMAKRYDGWARMGISTSPAGVSEAAKAKIEWLLPGTFPKP